MMTIRDLRERLAAYPDDYIPVISKSNRDTYIIVAIDPESYEQDNPVINDVIQDRREHAQVRRGQIEATLHRTTD